MNLWIEFLNLIDDENIYFEVPFFHGKLNEDNKEVTWEIGFDESGKNILIVFEDAKYTVQIRTRDLLKKARGFATGKTMWHKRKKKKRSVATCEHCGGEIVETTLGCWGCSKCKRLCWAAGERIKET